MKKIPKIFLKAVKAGKVKAHSSVSQKQVQKFLKKASSGKVKLLVHKTYTVHPGTDEIYMVASRRDHDSRSESRTWGFVMTEKEARDAVAENAGDMCEAHYYKYACIEKLKSGIFCVDSKVIAWYKWVGIWPDGKWIETEIPDWVKSALCLTL